MKYLLILLLHNGQNWTPVNFEFTSKEKCLKTSHWIEYNIGKSTVLENCSLKTNKGFY